MTYTPAECQEALRPIASLISKSEKARQKLTPGTWQHTMLGENIAALCIAESLMKEDAAPARHAAPGDLQEAIRALASMIGKTKKSQANFASGTSQHTLQRNRLKALHIAEAVVKNESARRE